MRTQGIGDAQLGVQLLISAVHHGSTTWLCLPLRFRRVCATERLLFEPATPPASETMITRPPLRCCFCLCTAQFRPASGVGPRQGLPLVDAAAAQARAACRRARQAVAGRRRRGRRRQGAAAVGVGAGLLLRAAAAVRGSRVGVEEGTSRLWQPVVVAPRGGAMVCAPGCCLFRVGASRGSFRGATSAEKEALSEGGFFVTVGAATAGERRGDDVQGSE